MCSDRRPSDADETRRNVVMDPKAMRDVFRRSLRPASGRSCEILGCSVGPMRRREGYRFAVEYVLAVHEPATGRSWDQVVTGVVYAPEVARRLWEELRGAEGSPAPFAPFAFVPELDMLVQVFPHDHRLPALAALMAGPPPELAPSLLAGFGPEGWRIVGWHAAPIRYRVDARATVRLEVRARHDASGRQEERGFFAKVFRAEADARRVDDTLRRLRDGIIAGGARFAVPEPVAFDARLRTVLLAEVPGTPLLRVLRREHDPIPAVRAAARAVAAFHRLDVAPDRSHPAGEDPGRSLSARLTRMERAADLLRAARPALAPAVDEIVAAVVAGLAGAPPGPTHGDLKPDHVFVAADGVALIDFDLLLASDPIQDVASMVEQVARTRPPATAPSDGAETAARVFVDEYFVHAPAAGRARLPLYHAMAAIVRAARVHSGRAVGRSENVDDLLRNARTALAEATA